ncbi:hypothetical protein [Streptomyces sparsogenes]|uniref:RAMA domain-containing protein n=1 Tax=Streptomyces sparsogenes DSM 40356 TaxID=1331668 RepID=A0A1R1SPX4_9ACTN|nr:hypothetical protein [Streptomyces sparsogenes]OMI40272.1 hypothetical protein SPAR_06840 [Streptomyces sparsogenes DSM 40356]
MPNRSIEIDDDVFAFLQRHSEPLVDTPNAVLRRLLLSDEDSPTGKTAVRKSGDLLPIIEAGLAAPGDKLQHHQPRRQLTHEATITADGWVELPDGRAFPKPSPALKAQTGSEINGWGKYIHIPSGRVLQELREKVRHI